jgi:multicomponent Na+:H+ antiporter subunit G
MSPISSVFILAGSFVAILASLGLVRFATPMARFHAAGKASPVAFLLVAIGASLETGPEGAARLAMAAVALILTLPVGVHLLFRAVYRTGESVPLSDVRPLDHSAIDLSDSSPPR